MSHSYGVTEYPNTFKRQGSFPLDKYSKFDSLNEANEYAANNPVAYSGQIISVEENNNVDIYKLVKNINAGTGYILTPIDSFSDESINNILSNVYETLDEKIGLWTMKLNDNNQLVLDFDIFHSLESNSFSVYVNESLIYEKIKIGNDCNFPLNDGSSLSDFIENSINNMYLIFYNNSMQSFKCNLKYTRKTEKAIFGSLYLNEIF